VAAHQVEAAVRQSQVGVEVAEDRRNQALEEVAVLHRKTRALEGVVVVVHHRRIQA
jgi:hypothetical protein